MKKQILTVTLNPAIDKTIIEGQEKVTAGGKGINVARTIKSLGASVLATGFSGGRAGQLLESLLDQERISHQFVNIKENIRTNLTVIKSKKGKPKRLLEAGPNVSRLEVNRFKRNYQKLLKLSQMVVLSGRSLLGEDSLYYDLIRLARRNFVITCLDSSGQALKQALSARPNIIKLNLEEAQMCLGRKLNNIKRLKEALLQFSDYGIAIVIITLGKKGALAFYRGEIWQVKSPIIKGNNDVGCGDAFLGGFINSFFKRDHFKNALRLAAAAGAANIRNDVPGLVDISYVKKLASRIKVSRI